MTKINFKVTPEVETKIERALRKSGDFETGGILIGKKIEDKSFEIVDVSVSDEDNKYSITSFIRGIKKSDMLLRKHYKRKSGYYIGEWHSHPKFSLSPSCQDIATMIGILADDNYGVTFNILMITKMNNNKLDYQGYFFHKNLNEIIVLERSEM
ncbi:Mov34/MPN/PAD-1 family protein [Labilibaculum euxinus]